jgi:hypothetical protein
MRILLVALSLLLGGTAAWAQDQTIADPRNEYYRIRSVYTEFWFVPGVDAWRNWPKFGGTQTLDIDRGFGIGGGIVRYWPLNQRSSVGLGAIVHICQTIRTGWSTIRR